MLPDQSLLVVGVELWLRLVRVLASRVSKFEFEEPVQVGSFECSLLLVES